MTVQLAEAERRRLTTKLEAERGIIAERAARLLVDSWSSRRPRDESLTPSNPATAAEALGMFEEAFRQMGGVLSLSVLVDEPQLLTDDMQWARRMLEAREIPLSDREWMGVFLGAFVRAAEGSLTPREIAAVQHQVDRALAGMDAAKPV
jgi:hypothetical protein